MPGQIPWGEILHKVSGDPDVRYRVRHIRQQGEFGEELPKGGHTIVEIGKIVKHSLADPAFEVQAIGVAYCNPTDSYNRKEGRDRALRRALKELKS